jgi:hypothetical protein
MLDIEKLLKFENIEYSQINEYGLSAEKGYVVYRDKYDKIIRLKFKFCVFYEYQNNTLVYIFNKQSQQILPEE